MSILAPDAVCRSGLNTTSRRDDLPIVIFVQAAFSAARPIPARYCIALTRLSRDALCPNFAPLSMSSPAREVSCAVTITFVPVP
jgi:hypothetical protein